MENLCRRVLLWRSGRALCDTIWRQNYYMLYRDLRLEWRHFSLQQYLLVHTWERKNRTNSGWDCGTYVFIKWLLNFVRLLASSVLSSKISMRYFYRCMNSTSLLNIEYWIFFSYTVKFLARFYCVNILFIYVALNKFFFFLSLSRNINVPRIISIEIFKLFRDEKV